MDTHGTDIVLGKIELAGKVHGALNGVVTFYDDPDNWLMKQFVSQEQLEQFAKENQLMIVETK
jgi:hypothetical protein